VIRKLILWIVLGLPPLLLLRWDEKHGHQVPSWLLLLSAAPLIIAAWLSDNDEEPGPIANFLLFALGLFGIFMGIMGFALRDSTALNGMGPLLVWCAPVGLVMVLVAVIRGLRD
jgi:hypothetical protein